MRLFTYKIQGKPNAMAPTPVGGHLDISRRGIAASLGIRGWRGVAVAIPLETESHWLRRRQREHETLSARMLKR